MGSFLCVHDAWGFEMSQKRVTKTKPKREEAKPEAEATVPAEAEVTAEDIDAMLDEIDSVLEENAEEFLKGYLQKGGE